jgi:hypothetical protein
MLSAGALSFDTEFSARARENDSKPLNWRHLRFAVVAELMGYLIFRRKLKCPNDGVPSTHVTENPL